jgi:ATP-dependent Clp protease ATP-binding subunit ClpC
MTLAMADLSAIVAAGTGACRELVEDVSGNGRIAIAATSLAGLTLAPTTTAAVLTPALASYGLRLVLTVSPAERARFDALEAGLRELFDILEIDELGKEHDDAVAAVLGARFGERHGVNFTLEAASAACALARRYLKQVAFPGSLAVLLDDVAGRARFQAAGTEIDEGAVQDVVSVLCGVPVAKLSESEVARVQTMEEHLHERIVGQDEAVAAVARAIRRAKAGIKDPKRPVGSFLFLGPSGVGKTELAKALAEFLFGDESALITFDMSEYGTEGDATKLIGTGPQWIGHDEGGQLTGAVKNRPYCVLLFDEVEKAHPFIFDLFLQLLDEGRLTDGSGIRVDFANTVVIMTSNLGTTVLTGAESYEEMRLVADRALKAFFRPELLNRIDETIVFHRLTPAEVRKIAGLLIGSLSKRTGVDLELTAAAIDLLVREGYDPELGARPLRRALSRLVEDPLADLLLAGKAAKRVKVDVDIANDMLVFAPS